MARLPRQNPVVELMLEEPTPAVDELTLLPNPCLPPSVSPASRCAYPCLLSGLAETIPSTARGDRAQQSPVTSVKWGCKEG